MTYFSKPSIPVLLISSTTFVNILVFMATMYKLFAPEPSITYSTSALPFDAVILWT